MNFKNFYEFEEYYSIPYSEKKYDQVLNLLHRGSEFLPKDEYEESLFDIMMCEARIYSETNNIDKCLKIMRNALEKGYSIPLNLARFKFLKDHPEYDDICKLNKKRLNQSKDNAEFNYEVSLPKSYEPTKKYPLFLCLHGDGFDCNMKNTSWYWKADELLEKGYIVVYAQSSQMYFHNGFGWLIDSALSRKELNNCYEQLLLDYSIDEKCVLIGGFSGGATTSIDIAFNNTIPIKGVIALCPGDYLDNIEDKDIMKLVERKTKIVILEGDQDADPVVQHILKLFRKFGLVHQYHINKGIGHEYPKDLVGKTLESVEFLVRN